MTRRAVPEEGVSPIWEHVRASVTEFFVFWPDGGDRLWAKAVWPALEAGGLYSDFGEDGLQWTRANVVVLSLLYAESVVRLGLHVQAPHLDRHWILVAYGLGENCERRLIEVRKALCATPAPEAISRGAISSAVRGSGEFVERPALGAYLDVAYARLPDMTRFREDRVFGFWNGAILDPLYFECLP